MGSNIGRGRRTCWSESSCPAWPSLAGCQVSEFEQHLQVLSRHAGAGTDEVFDEDSAGRVRISELERGQETGRWSVPAELLLIDQFGEHQRREAFRIRRDDVFGVGVHP